MGSSNNSPSFCERLMLASMGVLIGLQPKKPKSDNN